MEKNKAARSENYDEAQKLVQEMAQIQKKLNELSSGWKTENHSATPTINSESIAKIVSDWTGVPVLTLGHFFDNFYRSIF